MCVFCSQSPLLVFQEGFNTYGTDKNARARLGFIANQENDCDSPDSYLGFGTLIYGGITNSAGNFAHANDADNGSLNIKAIGYIMVR